MAKLKIDVHDLHKYYGENEVLKGISTKFYEGDVVCIIGPSGSGKSTFLRSLNLLEEVTKGQITVNGYDLTDPKTNVDLVRENIGMVFQDYNLFPNKTVLGNIIEGPTQVLKQPKKEAIANAHNLLAKVGLTDYGEAYPNELSGGQAQRVAIARALAMSPKYILLDEPTSALDPELELSVLKVLLQLAEEKQSMVIVTHNMVFAKHVADKIIFVENGEILYDGTPDEFFAPDNPNKRIKNFIASMTMENLK